MTTNRKIDLSRLTNDELIDVGRRLIRNRQGDDWRKDYPHALVPVRSAEIADPMDVTATLRELLSGDDIRELLEDAAAPIIDRPRTLVEWWNDVDIYEQQLDRKLDASEAAAILVADRMGIAEAVMDIARMARQHHLEQRQTVLAALQLEQEIASRVALREARLKTERLLEEQKQCALSGEIEESAALRNSRINNQHVADVQKHRKLLQEEAPQAPPVSKRELMIRDHRDDLRAKATVRRETLNDLDAEVKAIFNSRLSGEQKVAQIRAALEVYQQDESVLPKRVRAFLTFMEPEGGEDD